jgi:hypothetical protein
MENLILILSAKLKGIYAPHLLSTFTVNNVSFKNILDSNFIGFYDWLRLNENQICGIRLIPFDFAEDAVRRIPAKSYLKSTSNGTLEIYFTDSTGYIEEMSCDQDFGTAKVYISNDSEYAIGFNTENLTLIEQENLNLLLKENQLLV